jgi:hypothetical protein
MANNQDFGEIQVAAGVTIHWSQTSLKPKEDSDNGKASLSLTITDIPSEQVQQILLRIQELVSGSLPFELSPSNESSDPDGSDESGVWELMDSSQFGEADISELPDFGEIP